MRAWFNGRMEASQALDEGSIPFARFLIGPSMPNESTEFETKSSNKDLWLFLIILDVVFLCVFGFFLYKHFSGQLVNKSAEPAVSPVVETVEETVTVQEPVQDVSEQPVVAVPAVEEAELIQPVEQIVPEREVPSPEQTPAAAETKQSVIITPTTGKYRRVTFRWFGPGERVSIVSGFTMSKPQALKKVGDYWETTLSIAPGTYKFLYIIDGKNTLDPYSQEKDGRSLIVVK